VRAGLRSRGKQPEPRQPELFNHFASSISYGQNGQNLTLKDFNFNFSADGYLYIDRDEGIVLATKSQDGNTGHIVNLGRVEDRTDVHASRAGTASNPGVSLDLRYGADASSQGNLIRLGASGGLSNAKILFNANQAGIASFTHVNRGGGNAAETLTAAAAGYGFKDGGGGPIRPYLNWAIPAQAAMPLSFQI